MLENFDFVIQIRVKLSYYSKIDCFIDYNIVLERKFFLTTVGHSSPFCVICITGTIKE